MLVRPFALVFSLACLAATLGAPRPLSAQQPDLPAASEAYAVARSNVVAAKSNLEQAGRAAADAEFNLIAVEGEVQVLQVAVDAARQRGVWLAEGFQRLTTEAEGIRGLQKQLAGMPPDASRAQRRDLELKIQVYRQSLDRNAKQYGDHRTKNRDEVTNLEAQLEAAKQKVAAARDAAEQAARDYSAAEKQLAAASIALSRARRAFRLAAHKLPPPFLREIKVESGSVLVYHARWIDDERLKRVLADQIAELETEIADLEARLPELEADREKYLTESRASEDEIRRLLEEIGYNEQVDAVSVALMRFGQVMLAAADVAQLGKLMQVAFAAGLKTAGRKAITGATDKITRQVAAAQVWRRIGLRGAASAETRRLAAELVEQQAQHLAAQATWQRIGTVKGVYDIIKRVKSPKKLYDKATEGYPLRTPSIERLAQALAASEESIGSFAERRDDLDTAAASRKAMQLALAHEMNRAYQEQLNELAKIDEAFLRKYLLVGKIVTPDTAISIAQAQAGIAYNRSMQRLSAALYSLVAGERQQVESLLAEKRELLDVLHRRWHDAPVRRLEIVVNNEFTVGDGANGTVTLSFDGPLGEAPVVGIGEGGIAAPADRNNGEGSPLPDPMEGAVLVPMEGADAQWRGTFDATRLKEFADRDNGIPITIIGKDAAGKQLDADPGTEAGLEAPGKWINWESFRDHPGSGQGGADTWHVLDLRTKEGTSYCFVVDASGSMEEGNRMQAVKDATRNFVDQMKPGDETALWVFFNCGDIRLMQPFTRDKQQLLDVLEPVHPAAGTPLAAAIREGGRYLLRHGRYDNKALVVLTDGEESCQGDPVAAAAEFRALLRVYGYGMGGVFRPGGNPPRPKVGQPTPAQPTTTSSPGGSSSNVLPNNEPKPDPVKVKPADRTVWSVEQSGTRFPTFVLVKTRFVENGSDGNCRAMVVQEKFYSYYGTSAGVRGWGINKKPASRESLAEAASHEGQAAMDRVRGQGAAIEGTSRADAEREIKRRIDQILDRLESN